MSILGEISPLAVSEPERDGSRPRAARMFIYRENQSLKGSSRDARLAEETETLAESALGRELA
jgi:hypothetical protein